MPGYKISQLNPTSSLSPTNLIAIVEPGSTKNTTLSSLHKAIFDGSLSPNPFGPSTFNQNIIANQNLTVNGSLILTAPNGNKYNISVNNFGVLSAVAI